MTRSVGRAQCPRRTTVSVLGAAPASPSRPSTHRSRVPTAFLALAQGECKVGSPSLARKPSTTTSVSRVGRRRLCRPHRLAPDQDRLHVSHVDSAPHRARFCPARSSSASRARKSPRRRAWRRDVDPEPGERVGQSSIGRPHCSTIDRKKVKSSCRASPPQGAPVVDDAPIRSSTTARYRSSFVGKCRYTVPAPTPARRALSSIGTAKPWAAKVT